MSTSPKKKEITHVPIPWQQIPGARVCAATERGVARNLLFHTWGGLGDQACAEPTLRYALKHFTKCDVSLVTDHPELFSHLKFKRVFHLNEEQPSGTSIWYSRPSFRRRTCSGSFSRTASPTRWTSPQSAPCAASSQSPIKSFTCRITDRPDGWRESSRTTSLT